MKNFISKKLPPCCVACRFLGGNIRIPESVYCKRKSYCMKYHYYVKILDFSSIANSADVDNSFSADE